MLHRPLIILNRGIALRQLPLEVAHRCTIPQVHRCTDRSLVVFECLRVLTKEVKDLTEVVAHICFGLLVPELASKFEGSFEVRRSALVVTA